MPTPRPVLIALSVAAGVKALLATAAITDLIGAQVAGAILGVLLAVDVGVAFYLQGRVTPVEDVVIYERANRLRAGEAAAQATGSIVRTDEPVGVVAGLDKVRRMYGGASRGTPGTV